MSSPLRLLLLGGTTEGSELAKILSRSPDIDTISSLAGRVAQPSLPIGRTRIGGFGGVDGLKAYILERRIDAVIDATHPYAVTISERAAQACDELHMPYLALVRPEWQQCSGDVWHSVNDVLEAAAVSGTIGRRIFLTIGRQALSPFAGYTEPWYLIRSIDPPTGPLPARHTLLLDRGPFDCASERALLRNHRIDVLVSKNSGGLATYAKIEAARSSSVPVVMIQRPMRPVGKSVASVGSALAWVKMQST